MMNEMMLIPMRKLVFVLFCFAFAALPAYAVPQLAEGDMPVKINADDMEYDINRSRVIFTGNVHVVRGAFDMVAPKMTVYLKNSEAKQEAVQIKVQPENMPLTGKVEPSTKTVDTQNKINKIKAENGVRFKFENQSGHSDSAVYEADKGLLTMIGDPVVQEGKNSIRGETILYYLYERKSEVVGSQKRRVEAIFDSKQ
ncbi:MAG TPA: hypothetical protein DEB43_03085 [Desulfovibrio sp.]|nr:hypothetical protein [Desulfovibrio sp.]